MHIYTKRLKTRDIFWGEGADIWLCTPCVQHGNFLRRGDVTFLTAASPPVVFYLYEIVIPASPGWASATATRNRSLVSNVVTTDMLLHIEYQVINDAAVIVRRRT